MARRFSTILVANRGEIARRVFRTARAEGYRTVAVHSSIEADAPHARDADVAVCIGGATPGESYLSMERVLAAAKSTGAEAIHPGYGFLSENAAFAQACAAANIVFIGPPAKAIAAMGDKAAAKRLAQAAGVPCVPGYEGEDQSDDVLQREAERIGYPVLLKASAGGGGRGMRRVNGAGEFAEALAGARAEARKAFGDDRMIVEKLIEGGRHVEIQVFADEHGNLVHLGERDCSVQRRHQKIIEESPCPVMTPALREAMGAAAIKTARAAGYVNAGTAEFLLDDTGHFYFLEMNTRLQVEHPVTEMVTGLDLVSLQIAVAQGERLPFAQDAVRINGHAIEARLYAEDPWHDFAPQTGKVLVWRPAQGTGIRIDHGIADGFEVSPFYDAMLAKLIAWGPTRDEARARLDFALRHSTLLGVKTNAELLRKILVDPVFAAGEARTTYVQTSGLLHHAPQAPGPLDLLAAAATFIERDSRAVPASLKGWRSTGPATVPLKLSSGAETFDLRVTMTGPSYSLASSDETFSLNVTECAGASIAFDDGSRRESARYAFSGGDLHIDLDGRVMTFTDVTYRPRAASAAASDGVLKAPIVGQIARINVVPGALVAKGDVLVVIEAMKMENQVVAPAAGTVESIHVAVGDQVEGGRPLLRITLAKSTEN